MQERALRKVLLIQAIEETDPSGEALPLAERSEATRAVIGNNPPAVETQAGAPLSSATEWFLIRRADALLKSLRGRSPGIDHVLALAGGATSLDRGVLVLAFALGVILSFLDGGHGLNIFALPLLLLIAWNLLVYVWLSGRARKTGVAARPSWFGLWYARWVRLRIDKLLGHSTRFNAPLAPGLRRFAADWWDVAQPLFAARARRLLHFAAGVAALGLIVGYYIRALLLRSAAGWEGGGAIGSHTAHTLLAVLYGPASLLSGVGIPAADELERWRWSAPSLPGVGEPASWAHLIAWTAALYVVLPRLILALVATFDLWRLSRRITLPPGMTGYVRALFAIERFRPGNGDLHDV